FVFSSLLVSSAFLPCWCPRQQVNLGSYLNPMDLINTYFYTATIMNWYPLLKSSDFKYIIIESFEYLTAKEKVRIYGFVIMPNHIHLIWQNLSMNGKELPDESFLKFTAHVFKKKLKYDSRLDNVFLV